MYMHCSGAFSDYTYYNVLSGSPLSFSLVHRSIGAHGVHYEHLAPLSALVEGGEQFVDSGRVQVGKGGGCRGRLIDLGKSSNGIGNDLIRYTS